MWICYQEQKSIISSLLVQAQNNLENIPCKFMSAEQVKAEISSTHELRNDLERATDVTLQRLKDLSGYIVTITSSDGAEVMNEEVGCVTFKNVILLYNSLAKFYVCASRSKKLRMNLK